MRAWTKALLVNRLAVFDFRQLTKVSISIDKLFHNMFNINSKIKENVCFLVLVKSFLETLNSFFKASLNNCTFNFSKMKLAVFFQVYKGLITT